MTDIPKVTVITIVRNDAEGFLITARSILKQDYPALEWVVVDGLSDDGTSEYVRALSPRMERFVIERDTGIYNAMNKGIDMAGGDWVFFLNAGDVFVERTTVSDYMSAVLPDDDLLYADVQRREDREIHPYMPFDKHWAGMPVDHQSLCVRREIYTELRFDESYMIAGDFDFVARAIRSGYRFRKLPGLISCRKPFAEGASSGYVDRQSERIRVLRSHFHAQPWREVLQAEYRAKRDAQMLDEPQFAALTDALTV